MTRINFYEVQGTLDASLALACRLTEKAFKQDIETLLFCPGHSEANQLSTLLWAHTDTSFLPHQFTNPEQGGEPGSHTASTGVIGISWGEDAPQYHGLLINLTTETPAWFRRFDTLAEIVTNDPEQRQLKRERYRFYRDRGYPLAYHNLSNRSDGKG